MKVKSVAQTVSGRTGGAAFAAGVAPVLEVAGQAHAAVGAAAGLERVEHFLSELGILPAAWSGLPGPPGVVAAAGDAEQPAEPAHGVLGGQPPDLGVAVVHGCERMPKDFF